MGGLMGTAATTQVRSLNGFVMVFQSRLGRLTNLWRRLGRDSLLGQQP
jgi:hypothetical protein